MKNIFSALIIAVIVFSSSSYAASQVVTNKPSGEVESAGNSAKKATPSKTPGKETVQQEAININTANAQTLTNLKGIGSKKAEAIIAWRKANGGFKTIEQFADVKGIGAATLNANRKYLRVQ